MKYICLIFLVIISKPHLPASDFNIADIVHEFAQSELYVVIKGSGYSVREFEGEFANTSFGEWHFTTIMSVSGNDPRLFVSFEPMRHPVHNSREKNSVYRRVWYNGEEWVYDEERISSNPTRRRNIRRTVTEETPSFMGNVDEDGDFFGLTFVPWRYGLFMNYSLLRVYDDTVPFIFEKSYAECDSGEMILKLANVCNVSEIRFDATGNSAPRIVGLRQYYNMCRDSDSYPFRVLTFDDFEDIESVGLSIPRAFEHVFHNSDGAIRQKRFGQLESFQIVDKSYVDEIFAQKNQSAIHPNRNYEPAQWARFFSQFDRIVRNSIRFSSVEVFSAFDDDGVATIMTKEDSAYWADFENKSYQDFSRNSFRHSSWGTGRSGGSFFNHSEEGILLSLNHQIGSFVFENLNLNRKPFSTERSPRVNIRRHPRQSHSPINLIMYNGFGSPIWKRDFHMATDLNETQKPRFYDETRTHFFELDPETQLPALIGQFMRDEDGNVLGLQRIIELEDFLVVDGYSIPTQIRAIFFDLDSNRPTHQTEYFIRPNTVEIGPDVQPLFQRDSLIPIGASVNNHIANISYIHSETLGWGEKNAQELK